jgi:hypothetical protein
MVGLAVQIELANMVAVQCPHDADPREHRRAVRFRDQDQRFHGSLPLRRRVLGLRKLRDVGAGVLQRDELAAARQRNRLVEPSFPAALNYVRHELLSKATRIFADLPATRTCPNDIRLRLHERS